MVYFCSSGICFLREPLQLKKGNMVLWMVYFCAKELYNVCNKMEVVFCPHLWCTYLNASRSVVLVTCLCCA